MSARLSPDLPSAAEVSNRNVPDESAPETRSVSERDGDMLTRALQAVRATATPSATAESIALVGEAVRRLRDGQVLPDLTGSLHTASARPALELLRRRILGEAHEAGDQEAFAESHALFMAIEQLHDRLSRDDLYRVVDQMAGATALDLLVEVAHDMRSPLGAILFLVDRVRSGQSGPISAGQARQLGLAYSAAFGLSSLTSDVMELSRGSGRLMGVAPEPFTISEVLREVEGMVRPVAEEKGLVLEIETVPRVVRLGHPAALSRVLLNLSTNACKFSESGVVSIEVRPGADGQVAFHVRDSGGGVPPQVAARLFDAFRPRAGGGAAGGNQAFSSAGLGLAICRKLVVAMGGELHLAPPAPRASVRGARGATGSCFSFVLQLPPSGAQPGS